MKLHSFVFNPFYENTYLLYDETGEAVIVDPACYRPEEQSELVDFIATKKLHPVAILNTHCHIDHVLGNAFCQRQYGVRLHVPHGEKVVLDAAPSYSSSYGLGQYEPARVDQWLDGGGTIGFGQTELSIHYAPGHSPGHVMYYHEPSGSLIAGDVIFRESIGRTDLPGGDYPTLERSIREKVYTLPGTVTIYPGHGPSTTVAHEMTHNPFVTI